MVEFDASLFRLVGSLVALVAFFVLLFTIALIDWRTRRIPNALVFALVVLRVVVLGMDVAFGQTEVVLAAFAGSVATAFFFVVGLLLLKGLMERALHKECVGLGDVKLLGAGCLFLDLGQAMAALAVASVVGIVTALYFRIVHEDPTFPFGPALCCGLFAALFL